MDNVFKIRVLNRDKFVIVQQPSTIIRNCTYEFKYNGEWFIKSVNCPESRKDKNTLYIQGTRGWLDSKEVLDLQYWKDKISRWCKIAGFQFVIDTSLVDKNLGSM